MKKKLSEAVEELILSSSFLQTGMSLGVLNLAETANVFSPHINARIGEPTSISALHKALTRMKTRASSPKSLLQSKFHLESLSVQSDLVVQTYIKTPENHKLISKGYEHVRKSGGFFNIIEGSNEITVISDKHTSTNILEEISIKPLSITKNVSALSARFDKKYAKTPGLLAVILQQLSLQGVNLVEVSSTYTELELFIAKDDVPLAFDTLYHVFIR